MKRRARGKKDENRVPLGYPHDALWIDVFSDSALECAQRIFCVCGVALGRESLFNLERKHFPGSGFSLTCTLLSVLRSPLGEGVCIGRGG